jgi:hypothetical protein
MKTRQRLKPMDRGRRKPRGPLDAYLLTYLRPPGAVPKLARLSGVSEVILYCWRRGTKSATIRMADRLLTALGIQEITDLK